MENSYTLSEIKFLKNFFNAKPCDLWKKAFDEYNSDPNNNKKSMSCRACYRQVYFYLFNKHNFQKTLINEN